MRFFQRCNLASLFQRSQSVSRLAPIFAASALLFSTQAVWDSASCAVASDRGLPLVLETVDEICVIQTVGSDHCRVVFIRDKTILATRLAVDEMQWTAQGDRFQLIWQDYWTAERVVEATKFSVYVMDEDPTQGGQHGPWWCMFRNMRDLMQPRAPE